MKSVLTVFLLAGCLFLGFSHGNHRNSSVATYLKEKDRNQSTLIWRLDSKGTLWGLNLGKGSKETSWQRIWPDQLPTLIRDEKNMHGEKALVTIHVSPECSFDAVWKLLEICAKEQLATCLDQEVL